MSRSAQRQDTEHDIPLVRSKSTDGITRDITSIRPERPVPTDPRVPHTIRNYSVVFAITELAALALSLLSH